MKIAIGTPPETSPGMEAGLQPIRAPGPTASILIASLAGFVLLLCPLGAICMTLSTFALPSPDGSVVEKPVSWAAVVITLLLFVPLHELMHLVWHPGMGTSARSVLVLFPKKLRFGIYYDGGMSRLRWLVMRLAPFFFLSILPAVFLAFTENLPVNAFLRNSLEVLMVVNGAGSGGDVVAAALVLRQVPRSARMCFHGGRAYWRSAAPADSPAEAA